MINPGDQISANLSRVREQVAAATRRSGRSDDAVKLVAVTKYVSAHLTRSLVEAGCHLLGESRPQQLWEKSKELASLPISWHMIGHLQRNKLKRTLPVVSLLQSVDSLRLLKSVQTWAIENQQKVAILIEVNISRDAEKHGFAPDEVEAVVRAAHDSEWIDVQGLMGMAGLAGGPEVARANFRELRLLRDTTVRQSPAGPALLELSMGMSRDFELAIEEGATLVRIGTTLFEGVDRSL
ncbi:MAG: YggS family pyridoxal phosphate-dependent enzyme [Pirellulaceae bacterium]|nr:YggS family pyridoxal phosphate-dependent enzyme [Pirellulaceae bacterium]